MDGPKERPGMPPPALEAPVAQPLDYARPGAADLETGGKSDVAVGVTCSILLMMIGTLTGIVTSLEQGGRARFFISVGLAALYCNGLAFVAYRDSSYRRVGVGLWIGLGVAAVIGGACFAHLK